MYIYRSRQQDSSYDGRIEQLLNQTKLIVKISELYELKLEFMSDISILSFNRSLGTFIYSVFSCLNVDFIMFYTYTISQNSDNFAKSLRLSSD